MQICMWKEWSELLGKYTEIRSFLWRINVLITQLFPIGFLRTKICIIELYLIYKRRYFRQTIFNQLNIMISYVHVRKGIYSKKKIWNRQFKKNIPSNYKICIMLLTMKRKKSNFCLKFINRSQFEILCNILCKTFKWWLHYLKSFYLPIFKFIYMPLELYHKKNFWIQNNFR